MYIANIGEKAVKYTKSANSVHSKWQKADSVVEKFSLSVPYIIP